MRTLIKGGTIVTAEQEFHGDILVEGETIRAIGTDLGQDADYILDASGKYVFPGGVDQHTHFSALCNVGDRDTAGYETTDSAIVGGTTTIVDFAPQDPDQGLLDSIDYRINVRAKDKACGTLSFLLCVSLPPCLPQSSGAATSSTMVWWARSGTPTSLWPSASLSWAAAWAPAS